MAPLYSTSPLVPDESAEQVEIKLSVDVALSTLALIEEVLDSVQLRTDTKARTSTRRVFRRICARIGISLISFLLFAGLAGAAAVLWIKALDDVRRCKADYEDATADDAPPEAEPNGNVAFLISTAKLSLDLACRLHERSDLRKAGWWRWLAFFALWYPLGFIGQILARLIAAIVGSYALGSNAVFLTFGLHTQLGYVIRSSIWLGSWFAVMSTPRHWADKSEQWNRLAEADDRVVWNDKFERVHYYMSRALLAYLLLCICGLLRAAAAKYLSLKFHHRNHFERMQKALVQENVVQLLSKPNSLAKSTIVTSMGSSVELKGMDCAHWAALKFVSRIVDGDDDIFGQVDQCSAEKVKQIKESAASVQLRLAELLSNDLMRVNASGPTGRLFSGLSPEPSAGPGATPINGAQRNSIHTNSQMLADGTDGTGTTNGSMRYNPSALPPTNTSFHNPLASASLQSKTQGACKSTDGLRISESRPTVFDTADDSSVLFTPGQADGTGGVIVAEDIMRAAAAQSGEQRLPGGNTGQLRINLGMARSKRTESMRKAVRDAVQQARDAELAYSAAEAIENIDESKQRGLLRRRRTSEQGVHADTRKAQRIANRLASAKEEPTVNVHTTVNQLQSYLMLNSHIRVLSLDTAGDEESETIDNSLSARLLGYYIFFNMRQPSSGLAIQKHEVQEAASLAGMYYDESAWELFDRNSDECATLEEVVDGVQQVYYNRKSLARTLMDNQNVVAQVENALGVTLFIAWVFVTAAVFDSGAVQRTWTALSAGLLSFSFIFGGSVRELFENAIFLFFTHPFDVGDIIVFEGDRYKVKAISLQYVNIGRVDGADVNVPTTEMRAARLHNVSRSDLMWDSVELAVDMDTPRSSLDTVAAHVLACIKASPKLFGGSYRVWWTEALQAHKLQLSVYYDHHDNGTDLITLNLARTAMLEAVANALKEARVSYTLPPVRGGGQSSEMVHLQNTMGPSGSGPGASIASQAGSIGAEQSKAAAAQMVLLA